jgi:uncharacterized protein YbaR (Trm112 family)
MTDSDPLDALAITVEDELHVCPSCGYQQGFHLAFVREGQRLRLHLICPSCGSRYDLATHL